MGWDTPFYLWRTHSAATSGIVAFALNERLYDFLYPLIASWILLAGIQAFQIEIVLPLILWIVCTLLIIAIVRSDLPETLPLLVAVSAGSTWFALFRVSADLHSNLLGLALMLGGTWVFLRAQREPVSRRFAMLLPTLGVIVFLSSLAHAESTIFISAVWILALVLELVRGLIKLPRFVAMLSTVSFSLLPGAVIFYLEQQWIASPLQGRLPAIPTMDLAVWVLYLGPIGLATLIATAVAYFLKLVRISSPLITLSFAWLTLSLTGGFAQYVNPSLTPFSERAVILTPTPLLASFIIPRLAGLKIKNQVRAIAMISVIILGASGIYYVAIGQRFYQSYISDSASRSLQFLQTTRTVNMNRSIFIFSDPLDAPGSGNHNSFWVGAYLGDHYSYLGRIDFLMAGLETPFTQDQATQISRLFFNSLPTNQLNNMTVVFIAGFNYPNPPPSSYATFLQPVGSNVFEVNRTAWNPALVILPAYSSILSSTGSWFWKSEPWVQSGATLKLNATRPSGPASVSFAFVAPRDGTYQVSIRLLDESPSNSIAMTIDGTTVHQLNYTGSLAPINVTIFTGSLKRGAHTVGLSLASQSSIPQLASLDYLTIKET